MSGRWPDFLLRNISLQLRTALEDEAQMLDIPIAEVVRTALCEHYELDCTPRKSNRRDDVWSGSRTILASLQPELFQAIRKDSEHTGIPMSVLVRGALEAHFQVAA